MRMADWTGIFVVIGVALLVFLLKYLVIRCYLTVCRRDERHLASANQRDSIVIDFLEATQQHQHLNRIGVMRGRKPPPKFENALKCSIPVSFIQVPDDGPPPTYEEYLAMARAQSVDMARSAITQPQSSTVVIIPEVHQPTTNHI